MRNCMRCGVEMVEDLTVSGEVDPAGLRVSRGGVFRDPLGRLFDLDVLDPSVFPGTGTPEPGGIDFLTAMRGVTKVCERVNLIGCDVNELCPPCDSTGASTAVACKIIREMLIAVTNRK